MIMDTGTFEFNSSRVEFISTRHSAAWTASWPHFPVVATSQLRLRPFRLTDIPPLVSIANAHHVADTAIDVPHPFAAEDARRWIESQPAAWAARQSLHWAVSLLSDNRLVGYVGLQDIHLQDLQVELRFWIDGGVHRGRYALEASQAALAFAFTTLEMNHVCAFHLERDALAKHTLAKIGMRQQTTLRQRINKWDQFEEVIVRAVSRSDWLESLSGVPTNSNSHQS
jgi:RimJ/RimL family protein N-acetyltransferase